MDTNLESPTDSTECKLFILYTCLFLSASPLSLPGLEWRSSSNCKQINTEMGDLKYHACGVGNEPLLSTRGPSNPLTRKDKIHHRSNTGKETQ